MSSGLGAENSEVPGPPRLRTQPSVIGDVGAGDGASGVDLGGPWSLPAVMTSELRPEAEVRGMLEEEGPC